MALRHRRRAARRGDRSVSDPWRAASGDDSAHAHSIDERGTSRSPRYVHSQYGCRIEGVSEARCVSHTPQRCRGCRNNGRALRGQNGHNHDEPTSRHQCDSA